MIIFYSTPNWQEFACGLIKKLRQEKLSVAVHAKNEQLDNLSEYLWEQNLGHTKGVANDDFIVLGPDFSKNALIILDLQAILPDFSTQVRVYFINCYVALDHSAKYFYFNAIWQEIDASKFVKTLEK